MCNECLELMGMKKQQCEHCGITAIVFTCDICGYEVCKPCFNFKAGLCKKCYNWEQIKYYADINLLRFTKEFVSIPLEQNRDYLDYSFNILKLFER